MRDGHECKIGEKLSPRFVSMSVEFRTYDVVTAFREEIGENINLVKCLESLKQKTQKKGIDEEELKIADSSAQRRVEFLLKHDKNLLYAFFKAMNRKKIDELTRKYLNFLPAGYPMRIKALISLFHKPLPLAVSERQKEVENLKNFDLTNQRLFLRLGNVQIPSEIFQHIITFIGYSRWSLSKIGRICKKIYLLMLVNWPLIKIKKRNMYDISLIVMKNVSKVEIDFQFGSSSRIRNFQIPYLLDYLENVKILKLHTKDIRYTIKFFKLLENREAESRSIGKKYPFYHISSLEFGSCPRRLSKIIESSLDTSFFKKGLDFKKIFPTIRILKFPPPIFDLSKFDTIEKLFIRYKFNLEKFMSCKLNSELLPKSGLTSFYIHCNFTNEDDSFDFDSLVQCVRFFTSKYGNLFKTIVFNSPKFIFSEKIDGFNLSLIEYLDPNSIAPVVIEGHFDIKKTNIGNVRWHEGKYQRMLSFMVVWKKRT